MSAWDSASGNIDWMIANGYVDKTSSWIVAARIPGRFWKTIVVDAGDTYFNDKQFRMQWSGAGAMLAPEGSIINSRSPNEIVFTLGNVSGGLFQVSAVTGPISDLSIVEADKTERYDAGERINPDYSSILSNMRQIRFMDWNHTNASDQNSWSGRPVPSQNSYGVDGNGTALHHKAGVPLEVMVELCNRVKADMWFCFPHAATDEYITEAGTFIRDNLDAELACTYEVSNEVWNFGFGVQRDYFEALGKNLWPDAVGVEPANDITLSAHGFRTWQMGGLIDKVYARNTDRRQIALNVQLDFHALGEFQLDAPVWRTYASNGNSKSGTYHAPYSRCTHLAITSYFGTGLLASGRSAVIDAAYPETSDEVIDAYLRETGPTGDEILSLEAVNTSWRMWNTEAIKRGLKMLLYEGGPHMIFHTGSQSQTSRDASAQWLNGALGAAFATDMIANWASHSESAGPYMQFQDVGSWSQFGQWTFQEFMGDKPQGYMAMLFTENSSRGNWWLDTTDHSHEPL